MAQISAPDWKEHVFVHGAFSDYHRLGNLAWHTDKNGISWIWDYDHAFCFMGREGETLDELLVRRNRQLADVLLPEHSEAVHSGWLERSHEAIWQRADGRYGCDRTRTTGEKWQLSRSPWCKQILDSFKESGTKELVLMAGSQCAKTAPMLIALCWSIAHDPGPTLWITGNDDLAKDASQERIQPSLERCPDLNGLLQDNRLDKTTWKIRTKPCTIDIAGAQSSVVLEQNPYRKVFGDEVRQWPDGSLQKVEKRQRSYTDAKRCLFSTPKLKGDEFHERYLAGTQYEWFFPCMKCGAENKLEWRLMKYDNGREGNSATDDGKQQATGKVFHADVSTVQGISLNCGACGQKHFDTPSVRRHILDKGSWQAQNPTPQEGVVSHHWNALLPPWIKWADLVTEWKRANELKKRGNIEPLKIFICESLGEPWEERVEEADYAAMRQRANGTGYFCPEIRRNVWLNAEPWELCKRQLLMADVQQDVLYFGSRAFGLAGVSRLKAYGRVFTFDDLRGIQQELGLKDGDVGIDEGFRPAEVRQACLKYGWKAMKGVDQEYFSHEVGPVGAKTKVRRIWAMSQSDPYIGKANQGRYFVPLVLFSAPGVNEMLELFLAGKGPTTEMPQDCSPEYFAQLAAVRPMLDDKGRKIWKQIARDDHWRDVEKMLLVGAIILDLVSSGAVEPKRDSNG